ncbi:hypothetical protein [Kiloniella litopenaei]|uniref:hypothetical protein n=1 Tax=Kiloniella litopenaei TaxID=1549748 RepID=UPI003BAC022B
MFGDYVPGAPGLLDDYFKANPLSWLNFDQSTPVDKIKQNQLTNTLLTVGGALSAAGAKSYDPGHSAKAMAGLGQGLQNVQQGAFDQVQGLQDQQDREEMFSWQKAKYDADMAHKRKVFGWDMEQKIKEAKIKADEREARKRYAATLPENERSLYEAYPEIAVKNTIEQQSRQNKLADAYALIDYRHQTDPKYGYMSVPGVGVTNVLTGQTISPYGQDGSGRTQQVSTPQKMAAPNHGSNLSPKARESFALEAAKAGRKSLAELNTAMKTSRGNLADINRFEQLMAGGQDTGGVLRNLPGGMAINSLFDAEIGEMQAISDRMTPAMRQGMPGAASDRDVAMFRGATFSPDKNTETNRNLIKAAKIKQENEIAYVSFMNEWATQNDGSLDGAELAWLKYADENPIFDYSDTSGSYKVNEHRVPWRQYFGLEEYTPSMSGASRVTNSAGGGSFDSLTPDQKRAISTEDLWKLGAQ